MPTRACRPSSARTTRGACSSTPSMSRGVGSRSAGAALAAAVLSVAGLIASCSGTPAAREADRPADQTAPAGSAPSGSTAADATAAAADTGQPSAAQGEQGDGPETATTAAAVTPAATAPSGTRIVVPTARERAIQRALAAAEDALARSSAEAILEAARALVDSEAITLPEGARLTALALARYRELAPSKMREVVSMIEKAHTLVAGTAQSFAALGWGYLEAGQYGPAEGAAASGQILKPFDTDLLLLRAKVLVATARWFQAQTPLDSLLKAEPDNAEALLLRATILWQFERDGRTAIEVVQNAFATHPEDLRFPELQGLILYDEGQRVEARLVLNALLARDPGRLGVVRVLLDDAIGRAAWTEAKGLLDRLPAPSTEAELLAAHTVARGAGDFAAAAALAARLDASAPDRRFAPLRVRSLLEAGDREGATGIVASALETTRDGRTRSELYYLRAIGAGEPFKDDAVRDLRQALAANPANADAVFAMARHYYAVGQARQAQQYARSALRDRPDDPALIELLRKIDEKLAQPSPP